MAVAQDERNNIISIAFVIIEGETVNAKIFFLKIPKEVHDDLCLILDHHNSINAVFARPGSGWT